MKIRFEWDPVKALANVSKHRVSFETAVRAFADPFALAEQDRIEGGEYRWQTLGLVDAHLLLLVAHTVWEEEAEKDGTTVEVIRIISAPRPEPFEQHRYETQDLSLGSCPSQPAAADVGAAGRNQSAGRDARQRDRHQRHPATDRCVLEKRRAQSLLQAVEDLHHGTG